MMRKINLFILKGMLFWIVVFAAVCGMFYWLQLPHQLLHWQIKASATITTLYAVVYYPIIAYMTRK